ncbi:MAG TPA: AAA family ATPase [Chitinophagales bacterium]|nr:AAA family ATPase [Chitinophagales bacterium]HMW93396.1 AAA family ATPase [Chitinophagales bacterium]HMZ92982.1 AAA family ATPase [Chitinophagales bacterium]HNG25955.1 AAA family ATPase [Chitinophagales bacterium]
MKIISLKAKNFWSYESIYLTFDKGLCLVDGYNYDEVGSNGAGKSGLFNAICYGLFGDIPKKIKSDDIINRQFDGECVVILEIENNNKKYIIERSRKPNILRFSINGIIQADIDSKKTQKLIEKEFGFTFDIFLNSVYFSQNSSNFLILNDEQKKSILTDLLDLKVFDRAEELVKSDFNKNYAYLSAKQTNYQKTLIDLEILNDQIALYKNKSIFFDNEVEEKLFNLNLELKQILDEIEDKNKKCEVYKNDLLIAQKDYDTNSSVYTEKLKTCEELEDLINSNITYQNEIKSQINSIIRDISKTSISFDQCPTCLQKVNQTLLLDIRTLKEEEARVLKINLQNIIEEIKDVPNLSELNKIKMNLVRELDQLKLKIETINSSINSVNSIIVQINHRLDDINKRIDSVKNEKNPYIEICNDFNDQLEKGKEFCLNVSNEIIKLEEDNAYLTDLKEIFGNKGIKAYVFDNIVAELNILVNQYLNDLFNGNLRIEFSSFSENSKGVIKQTFNQKIFVNDEEVSLGSFSGGEEKRLIFATNLALAQIVSNRSNKDFNIVFFDEVFDGLDYEGKKSTYTLLSKLFKDQYKKDSVLIIDHNTEFQTMFENVIKIEKRNGISRIVE